MPVTLTDAEAERIAVLFEEQILTAPNGTLPEGVRPDVYMFVDELRERQGADDSGGENDA